MGGFFGRGNNVLLSNVTSDGTLSDNSDLLIPSEQAVKTYVDSSILYAIISNGGGIPFSYMDSDATLFSDSDMKISTQRATKTYIDMQILNLDIDGGFA